MKYPSDRLKRILFLDIETASLHSDYGLMAENMQLHWQKKVRRLTTAEEYPSFEEEFAALYHDKAAVFAEFAKVICISFGYITEVNHANEEGTNEKSKYLFKVKSISGNDEAELLQSFHQLLNDYYYDRFDQFLCGHNLKEFDVPFLCRRSMVHGLKLPNLLDIAGYKPWQVHHLLDTMEMWKYGDYKHYTSLDLLCSVLGIHSPKSDMDGSEVSDAFWNDRLGEIVEYCQRDVIATARVYLRCVGLEVFDDKDIRIVETPSPS